jgi:class 3 adenylate cyclase
MAETRKLAAILAADVVGYSRLAGADEERTLARLRALRSDLIDPTIAVHHGCAVKHTGDGSIIEFCSVVDAVRCAIEVQNGMIERNAGLPPERRIRVPHRTNAPVRGFLPVRASRNFAKKLPNPRSSTRSPRAIAAVISAKMVLTIFSQSRR